MLHAALNGARHRAEHPALPVTPAELAAAAVEVIGAGARAIHFHARGPDGGESLAADDVALALGALRHAVPGTPLGVSTGARSTPDASRRLGAVEAWAILPDFASVNFDEAGAVALAQLLRSRGVGVEAGLANRHAAERLVDSGLGAQCLRVLLEPDDPEAAGALQTVAQLEAVLDRAGVRSPRLMHGTDQTAWRLLAEAAARGYDTRVGLEDTLTLPDGRPTSGNAALVAEARRRLREAAARR
jgi:uncharacterized protein (DUF849 family)